MIKYYCDICGNEGNDSEYSLPLNEIVIYCPSMEHVKLLTSTEELYPIKIHLCKHCALIIRNFVKNVRLSHDKAYSDFLWDISHRERQ